jgi:outer membrane protein assembly factor BamB
MAFDAKTLARTGAANLTPNGGQGGVWMGGGGPAFDADGNLYVVTGNGSWDGQTNFGQSLLKLGARKLNRIDFFTPFNFDQLNRYDLDFSSAGPSFLPGTRLIAAGSKEGKVYLLDSRNLGHAADGDRQIPQVLQAVDMTPRPNATHHLHGSNVVWNGPEGIALYAWGENDFLRAYRFDAGRQRFVTPAFAVSTPLLPQGMPGGMMTLSANGASPGTGVLWTTASREGDANRGTVPGVLRAFDAETLRLLWESTDLADDMTTLAKFNPPVVANGKVYVASFSKVISVYGPRSHDQTATRALTDGEVISLKNPGAHLCLNVAAGPDVAGAPLDVTDCNGTGAQVWQANERGGGQWELRRNGTALCIAVSDDSAGSAVRQDVCDGGAAQRFTQVAAGGGLQLRTTTAGLCVEVTAPLPSDPTSPPVHLSPCDDGSGAGAGDGETFVPLSPRLRNYNAMLCLDAPDAALTSSLPLRLWPCDGSSGQTWQLDDNLDGTVQIRRGATGLCLAAPPDNPGPGQRVVQATCDRGASQAWVTEPISGGSQIRLDGGNLCLDIPLSSTVAGAAVRLWDCNRSDAQRFGF